MRLWTRPLGGLALAVLASCGTTTFVSTWKAPDAKPLQVKGSKVAAVVMMRNESSRRAAEDQLARAISAHGAAGIPMYLIAPSGIPSDETAARAALEHAAVRGVVVMRPVGVTKDITAYSDPMYGGYWGGYYGYGWGHSWGGGVDVHTTTNVWVETLIYSLAQNKLVWGGQSKTTKPDTLDRLVGEIADATADELETQGLIAN